MTDARPHIAPEKFMGVPVPPGLTYHWDHVHAIHWRQGVRAAIKDIADRPYPIDWRFEYDTNPEDNQ